ncbi:MAG: hypothetical protein WDO19_31290 [Bacteroidota bacterium]
MKISKRVAIRTVNFIMADSVTHINVLDNSDEEMEKYFLKHYRRCWLDYIKEQNVVIKQLQGSNNREISRNILLEKIPDGF